MSGDAPVVVVAAAAGTAREVLADALPDVPSAELRRAFAEGRAAGVAGPLAPEAAVAAGARLEVRGRLARVAPHRLPGLEVLARAGDVMVVFKPAGVATQPERGADPAEDRFRAGLLHLLRDGAGALPRPRVAHRLDRGTSGAVAIALSRAALRELSAAFEARRVEKEYLALVHGRPRAGGGLIDAPLKGVGSKRPRSVVADDGKPARTRWEVVEAFGRFAWLRLRPETGRQHQLRAHLAHLGHPIVADPVYGGEPLLLSGFKRGYRAGRRPERPLLERVALHAAALTVPAGGAPLAAAAPLPKDLRAALAQLRKHGA